MERSFSEHGGASADARYLVPRLAWGAGEALAGAQPPLTQHAWRKYGFVQPRMMGPPAGTALAADPWTSRSLCVLGAPGSGKTTLLRHLVDSQRRCGDAVLLSWYDATGRGHGGTRPAARLPEASPETWILVDDVDVACDLGTVTRQLRRRYPDQRLLLSAPSTGLITAPPGFLALHLLPWTWRMLTKWLAAWCVQHPELDRGALAGYIHGVVERSPDLALTPMVVQFLATRGASVAGVRAPDLELYGDLARALLRRRSLREHAFALLDEDRQLGLLLPLAQAEEPLSWERGLALLADWLPTIGWKSESALSVLTDIGLGSGVLLRRAGGLRFACRDVREWVRWRCAVDERSTVSMSAPAAVGRHDLFGDRLAATARREAFRGPARVAMRQGMRCRLLRQYWQGTWDHVQQQALTGLDWLVDDTVVEHLRQAARCDSIHVRARAAEALTRLQGPGDLAVLRSLLHDPAWKVRIHAAEGVGRRGGTRAAVDLTPLLEDPHWQVRTVAAEALGRCGAEPATEALRDALQSGYRSRQHATASAFGRWRLDRAADIAIKAADDQDLTVRLCAAEALLSIGTERALSALTEALDRSTLGRSNRASLAAASVLAKAGNGPALDVIAKHASADSAAWRYRAAAAASYGPLFCGIDYTTDEREPLTALAPMLTRLADDEAWKVRGMAASALGSLRRPALALPLIPRLHDADHFVSTNAAVALGVAGCAQAAPQLQCILDDRHRPETTRAYAARSLGVLRYEPAAAALRDALGESGILVRLQAATALGEVGGEGDVAVLLERVVEDDEPSVRNAAFAAAAAACRRLGVEPGAGGTDPRRRSSRPIVDTISLIQRYV